jgi:serine protease AprX
MSRVLGALLVGLLISSATASVASIGARLRVIVRTVPGHEIAAERRVGNLGGRVEMELPIIDGFSATIPENALPAIAADKAVVAVTPDGRITLSSAYDPSGDPYSMHNVETAVRATNMWAAGYTGAGVDIALIDSGVAPVQGLSAPGKVINGPDLSFESRNPNLRYLDTYGHGTHMAGIIAGRDVAATPGSYATDTTDFLGMAPDARIVSIKVADSHGNADVSQIIAAIGWVVQHAHDNGLNIRVLNLSFGTASAQSYVLDPLAFATEVAWRQGIVVVAAVGNAGIKAAGLADPAYDPFVIAVGAVDHHGSMQYSQWDIAAFSQTGDGIRNPTIMAPGAHLQSLRDPGSYIDQTYPGGVISDRFFRGSGSSQAAAVVSGALADMFQEHPAMSPDQAKALLKNGANGLRPPAGYPNQGQLALRLDTVVTAPVPIAAQTFTPSIGTGTLESSRGTIHLIKNGVPLQGEQDIFGAQFDSTGIAALEAAGNSWSGGMWNGNVWSGDSWSGNSWSGNSWSSVAWSGNSWSGDSWSGDSWSGNSWTGNSWSGNSWSGDSWSGDSWSSAFWG